MAEDLPDEFDVVVIGTGMPESILAAAFARIGQSVLHIDRNPYYSGQWASFSLKTIEEWVQGLQKPEDKADIPDVKAEEVLVDLHLTDNSYSKHKLLFHISDPVPESEVKREPQEEIAEKVQEVTSDSGENKSDNAGKDLVSSNEVKTVESAEPTGALEDSKEQLATGNSSEDGTHNPQTSDSNNSEQECENQNIEANKTETINPGTNSESENKNQMSISSEQVTGWTESKLRKEWRKFNLDLSPKLLYCAGSMVELLITSDIAKYCEFKTVSRILTLIDGKLKRVPCSRADVFSSKDVSMIEKRMMMKFLTFCVNYEKQEEDYKDFIEKPYKEYLEHQKLSKNVIHFIQHAISMTNNSTLTPEGLKKTQKFLHSLGRYGNTAFLWPLYGSGEMPQSFCRMCAVFGGVYCLRTPAASLIVNSDNICTGVVMTTGKLIKCKHLVMETSYAPDSYIDRVSNRLVNRGILVTDKAIMSTDDPHQLSLLRIPDDGDPEHPATLLELPGSSMTCPHGLYVVHLTKECKDDKQSPEESLQSAITGLFKSDTNDDERPQILLSIYFQQKINIGGQSKSTPSNVILVPGPGPEIDIDQAVTIASRIFERVMPGEDFLPRPPNPEDIIFVDEEETQITQDSEKTEFNETSQDFEDNATKNESHEIDQAEKCSDSQTTDTLSECDQKQTDPDDQEFMANENSESANNCKSEEKKDLVNM